MPVLAPEEQDKPRSKAKGSLHIIGSIRQLRVLPCSFDCADSDVLREMVVEPTSCLSIKSICSRTRCGHRREQAIEPIRLADKPFAIDRNAVIRVPTVAWSEHDSYKR